MKPNIVLMLADDLGWNDVGYHGSEIKTPNIDRLAEQGIKLERFYVAPICSPTRAGLLTGRYPLRFGLMRAVIPPWSAHGIPPDEELLPEMLALAGYKERGIVGKWHLGHAGRVFHPLNRGFTYFYGHYNGAIDYFTHERDGELDWHLGFEPNHDKGYSTHLVAEKAVEFINRQDGKDPFFLYVAFNAPHSPLQAPEEYLAMYPELSGNRKAYAAVVTALDDGVGRILDALEARGLAENTVVLFLSDNGGAPPYGGSNRPLRGGKQTVFEGGVRVPAVVRWPAGLPGGRVVDAPLAYIDIFPTLRSLAGLAASNAKPLDGIDVSGVLRGEAARPSRSLYTFWAQNGVEERLAVWKGEWKLVYTGPDVAAAAGSDIEYLHLFRIARDPLEEENVASLYPDVTAELLNELKWFRSLNHPGGVPPYQAGKEGFVPPRDWNMDLFPKDPVIVSEALR